MAGREMIGRIKAHFIIVLASATCGATALEPDGCTNDFVPRSTPANDFTVIEPNIVRHEPTGLEWRRCALGQTWSEVDGNCSGSASSIDWPGALAAASVETGWRLPNVKELKSIVEHCRILPAVNQSAFPGTPSAWFWSSSPVATQPNLAHLVSFHGGNIEVNIKTSQSRVRLVRGGH